MSTPAQAAIDAILSSAITGRVFPGAVVEVGCANGSLFTRTAGCLTYDTDRFPVDARTIYDLASLTKVIATTTLMMRAVEAGLLSLDQRVADRLPAWRGADRESVTMADLLEHASGLTAYLPFFRDHHGRAEFERAICTLPLEYAPRAQSIYSDLGFMLLAFILEDVHRVPFASQFDDWFRLPSTVLDPGKARAIGTRGNARRALGFRLKGDLAVDQAHCAPTELDLWRGRLLQGEVHDENAWELGGAAGHAGLFGTTAGVGAFARWVLGGLRPLAGSGSLDAGRWKPEAGRWDRFARKSTVTGSSRALGWDTMLPTSSCGSRLSARAIGHTGFTGTSLWIDPEHDLYVVLLTNRVHPTRDNNQIQHVRRQVHDAVAAEVSS